MIIRENYGEEHIRELQNQPSSKEFIVAIAVAKDRGTLLGARQPIYDEEGVAQCLKL